jgi:hypothetical protein
MRSHGVPNFPDPKPGGGLEINGGGNLDPSNPQFQAADKTCKALLPPPPAPPAGAKQANLNYSKCMREHGISDFPDPNADGSLAIQVNPGGDLDPNNPQYQSADKACAHFRPGGGQANTETNGGGS